MMTAITAGKVRSAIPWKCRMGMHAQLCHASYDRNGDYVYVCGRCNQEVGRVPAEEIELSIIRSGAPEFYDAHPGWEPRTKAGKAAIGRR